MKPVELPCNFIDFAVHTLIPQPLKYRFLSKDAERIILNNAIAGNLQSFSGHGAELYEENHLQNSDALKDIHSNAASTIRLIKSHFTPGKRLLEVGCGTGYCSNLLLSQVDRAMFNDLSPDMVQEHRKRRSPQELKKIDDYHSGSVEKLAEDLATSQKTFDRIVSISTFHHLEHRDRQVALLWDRLEPGGQLLFIDPTHNLKRVLRVLRKLAFLYRPPYIPNTHDFLTIREVELWLKTPFFKDAKIRALGTTQFPLLGRLAKKKSSLYFKLDRWLNRIPLLRGQGNMLFCVLEKATQ